MSLVVSPHCSPVLYRDTNAFLYRLPSVGSGGTHGFRLIGDVLCTRSVIAVAPFRAGVVATASLPVRLVFVLGRGDPLLLFAH